MKYCSSILVFFLLASCNRSNHKTEIPGFTKSSRILICDQFRYGYLDTSGKIAIEPKFNNAGDFHDGLAPARGSGLFGYIDITGAFVIAPTFEYATDFSDGVAVVYKHGKPIFINQRGEELLRMDFKTISAFQHGKAIVETVNGTYGVINKKGQFVIPPEFSAFQPVGDNRILVQAVCDSRDEYRRSPECAGGGGVIDTLGHFIIPFGKFRMINFYNDGYFTAEQNYKTKAGEWDTKQVVLDRNGHEIPADTMPGYAISGNFSCGLIKVDVPYAYAPHQGFVNLKGEFILNDDHYEKVNDFSDNRAFVMNDNNKWSVINTAGKVIASNAFNDVLNNGFHNGTAFVSVNYKWGLIDTNMNFLIPPQFYKINTLGLVGDLFFYEEPNPKGNSEYDTRIGIARKDGSILTKPIFESIDENGFVNGLLGGVIDGKSVCFNKNGKMVWMESAQGDGLRKLNIDYRFRAFYHTDNSPNSPPGSRTATVAGNTFPSELFPKNALGVVVNANVIDTFFGKIAGYKVVVRNNSKRPVRFHAQDGCPHMRVQARRENGQWADIEYLPPAWCGNSYHMVTLNPEQAWVFQTPVFEGVMKTRMRIRLEFLDPHDPGKNWPTMPVSTIYSNEYDGSINPAQFWRTTDYTSRNLMNPYY